MKTKYLNRTKTFAGALLLTSLLACKPALDTGAQPAAAPAAPPAAVEPAKPAAPGGAGTVTYVAQPTGSKMKMDGTSTIHDWSMTSAVVGGTIEADAKFPESALTDAKAAKPNVQAFIPVRSLKSDNKRMDEVMQKHMNVTTHSKIEYRVIELKPKSAAGATGPLQFDAVGALTIAGKTRTNTMPVTIEKLADKKIKITGTADLKMTDYGVEPPAPSILGLSPIKTGDDVKLSFEWLAAPKAP